MGKTLLGVIYDTHTLAPRAVVDPHDDSHLDGRHVGQGQAMVTVLAQLYAGVSVTEAAYAAIRLKTGREPPPMDQVLAADNVVRGMTGAT
jgi:hypothetical protein